MLGVMWKWFQTVCATESLLFIIQSFIAEQIKLWSHFILFLNSKLQVVKYLIKVQPDGDEPLSTSFFLILLLNERWTTWFSQKCHSLLNLLPLKNPDLTSLRVNVTDNVNNKVMMYTMRFWCILSFCKCYTAESYLCLVFGKSWPWLPRLCFS